jgi:S1-C subfamily serine protease
MRLPRLSTFPLHKPFEREDPTTPLSEAGVRLVADIYTDQARVLGSAVVICGNLIVTAKHVLDGLASTVQAETATQIDHHLSAVQLLPGPRYIIWDIAGGVLDPTSDLALLQLATNPGLSHPEIPITWRQPRVNPFAPEIGERIVAFGYRSSSVVVSRKPDGGTHIELNDQPMTSVGVVKEIYEWRRDGLLPFPCYQVSARFDGGMSGGPVFDETGSLCGIVCSNIAGSHLEGEPVSYVTTLWPLFRLKMAFDRGDGWPKGGAYFGIDLARAGLISVIDIGHLNAFFELNVK